MAGLTSKGEYTNSYIKAEELVIAHLDSMIFQAEEEGNTALASLLEKEWKYRVDKLDEYIANLNK